MGWDGMGLYVMVWGLSGDGLGWDGDDMGWYGDGMGWYWMVLDGMGWYGKDRIGKAVGFKKMSLTD